MTKCKANYDGHESKTGIEQNQKGKIKKRGGFTPKVEKETNEIENRF